MWIFLAFVWCYCAIATVFYLFSLDIMDGTAEPYTVKEIFGFSVLTILLWWWILFFVLKDQNATH